MGWHSDLHRRKHSGGKRIPYRGKRKFEQGGPATETVVDENDRTKNRTRGGGIKVRLRATSLLQVSDPKTGKTRQSKILRVIRNPANVDYNRRGIITKGTVVETEFGTARITSRPGQNGVLNAVLVEAKTKT